MTSNAWTIDSCLFRNNVTEKKHERNSTMSSNDKRKAQEEEKRKGAAPKEQDRGAAQKSTTVEEQRGTVRPSHSSHLRLDASFQQISPRVASVLFIVCLFYSKCVGGQLIGVNRSGQFPKSRTNTKEQCRGATRNEAKTSEENANGERWNCDRLVERSDVTTEIARHWCSVRRRTVMGVRSVTEKEGENEKSDVSGTSVTGYSDAQRECGCEGRGKNRVEDGPDLNTAPRSVDTPCDQTPTKR